MKLAILIPSEEYKSFAGARIRYNRIVPALSRRGVEVEFHDVTRFAPDRAACDALLISKCHDATALVAAWTLSSRGKLVGVDLFDDYFSDVRQSRLNRFRSWLRQILPMCDFALASTSAMAGVVEGYDPELPVHVMNDPGPALNRELLSTGLASKIAKARNDRHIGVAWFGVGDNVHFRAGLADLAAYAHRLAELTRAGFSVELTILTNSRAMNADGLWLANQAPVPTRIAEWSEDAERDLLAETLVAFLPVNAQPFSTAKSLNRAVTALSAGCQLLSAGYPLYAALDPFIYRDASELAADLARGSLRLRPDNLDLFAKVLAASADAEVEAQGVVEFLDGRGIRKPRQPGELLRLVHGQATRPGAHDLVKQVEGLSVASPYCSAALDYDVIFRRAGPDLEMLVSSEAQRRMLPGTAATLGSRHRIEGRSFRLIGAASVEGRRKRWVPVEEPFALQLATYASVMKQIERRLGEAFGPGPTIFSETSAWPFPAVTGS